MNKRPKFQPMTLASSNLISNVKYKHTSSVDYTQNGLYNLKQYDHYKIKILNDLVHITLLYTLNICAEWKLCMQITIHKKHKHYT